MVVEVPAKSSKKVESSKGKKKEVEAMEETEEAVVKKDVAKASKRTTENVPAKQSTVSFEVSLNLLIMLSFLLSQFSLVLPLVSPFYRNSNSCRRSTKN